MDRYGYLYLKVWVLKSLNILFFLFHSALIVFNVTGWLFRRWRKYNLVALSATAFSWFLVGAWKGWGYCFCTDWHRAVRRKLGYTDNMDSYIQFLLRKISGIEFSLQLVDTVTLIVFLVSLGMSLLLNYKDKMRV